MITDKLCLQGIAKSAAAGVLYMGVARLSYEEERGEETECQARPERHSELIAEPCAASRFGIVGSQAVVAFDLPADEE